MAAVSDENVPVVPPEKRQRLSDGDDDEYRGITVEENFRSTCGNLVAMLKTAAEAEGDALAAEWEREKAALVGLIQERYSTAAPGPAEDSSTVDQDLEIVFEVTDGVYASRKFVVRPGARKFFRMGRSTGKTYVDGGVSLSDDFSVSTSHAKWTLSKGRLNVADLHSTNGTTLNGVSLEPNVSYPVSDGDNVSVGDTQFIVHVHTA